MKRAFARGETLLSRPAAGWVLLALLAVVYSVAYVEHELFPGAGEGASMRGWWTWSDQQRYLQQAVAIAHGELDAQSHFYPPGYAALGALFARVMPGNPFFAPNLCLVLGAATMAWRLARRWLRGMATLLAGVVFVSTHRWLVADSFVVPWNTLVTSFTLLAGIYLVTAQAGSRVVWQLAGLAAATYCARPIDAVAFAPLLAFATLRLPTWRERIAHGAGGAAIVLAAWAGSGALNLAIFGSWRTPYETASLQVLGFFGYPTSYKLFWLFLDGQPFFDETDAALLWRYPWLLLAAPAAIWWARRERAAGAVALGAVALNVFLYVSYNDFVPSGTYRFTLIHYLAWWFPLGFLLVCAACRHGWSDPAVRVGFAAAGLLAVAAAGLRLEPRIEPARTAGEGWVLPEQRPLVVHFPGTPNAEIPKLRLEGRTLVEPAEYLVAYVNPDLKVLLGENAKGGTLTLAGGATVPTPPNISALEFTWRISLNRIAKIARRMTQHAD